MFSQHECELILLEKQERGKGLKYFKCGAPQNLLASFQVPGQFLSLKVDSDHSSFALASPPGQNYVEFLIKKNDWTAKTLYILGKGDTILSSLAMGQGFPLRTYMDSQKEIHAVHLFSMGSGLAPLRSLWLHHLQNSAKQSIPFTLWQGSLDEEHLPFADEYDHWRDKGLSLELCLDRYSSNRSSANIVESLASKKTNLEHAVACWAGSKEFGAALAKITSELGLPTDALLNNLS